MWAPRRPRRDQQVVLQSFEVVGQVGPSLGEAVPLPDEERGHPVQVAHHLVDGRVLGAAGLGADRVQGVEAVGRALAVFGDGDDAVGSGGDRRGEFGDTRPLPSPAPYDQLLGRRARGTTTASKGEQMP